MTHAKRFRYSLAGIRRYESWKVDSLTAELAELRDQLEQRGARVRELDATILEHHQEYVSLLEKQPPFWLETRNAIAGYVTKLQQDKTKLSDEIQEVTKSAMAVMERLIEVRRSERILDKHRDRKFREYVNVLHRSEDKILDDLWLNKLARAMRDSAYGNK